MTTSAEYDKFVETASGDVAIRIVLVDSSGSSQSTAPLRDKQTRSLTTNGSGDDAIRAVSTTS